MAAIAGIAGLWLLASAFVFGDAVVDTLAEWNNVLVGVAALALGAYSAYKIHDWREVSTRTTA